MWERTLQDLIRGLRANKKDEAKFIAQAVDEIRNEVKSKDMDLKAGAVLKLTYVCVFGRLIPWAMIVLTFPAGHVGLRHEMGVVSRCGSHVFPEVSSQERWVPCCRPVL